MGIRTQNVAAIQDAVVKLLKQYPALQDRDRLRIEQNGEPNSAESDTPWIGVYRLAVMYRLRALGMGAGFRHQDVEFLLICQESDSESADRCAKRLENLVQDVNSALLSDPTLLGTVQVIDQFQVSYPNYARDKAGSYYFQDAAIQFTATTVTSADGAASLPTTTGAVLVDSEGEAVEVT